MSFSRNYAYFAATRRSPRKSERKAVYVLDLQIPPKQIDNCLEPAKAAIHLQVWHISFLKYVDSEFECFLEE